MKPIRLCVLDLDGTVLDPDREVPIAAPVVKAVARVLERGIGVTLATGRTLEYAAPRARAPPRPGRPERSTGSGRLQTLREWEWERERSVPASEQPGLEQPGLARSGLAEPVR